MFIVTEYAALNKILKNTKKNTQNKKKSRIRKYTMEKK